MNVSSSSVGVSAYETLMAGMQLYLLRHGISETKSVSGRDADRRLTQAGVAALTEILSRAHAAQVMPECIVSSPYLRAIETARLAAALLGYPAELLQSTALLPDSTPQQVWQEVRELARELAPAVLLVAHEPLLSATASWMIGETRIAMSFMPGTLVRIDFDSVGAAPKGTMQWKLDSAGSSAR